MKNQKKSVPVQEVTQNEQVRNIIAQYDAVSNFLRNLTDQVSVQVGFSAEVIKAMTLSRLFLEDQSRQARVQFPEAFKEQSEDAVI